MSRPRPDLPNSTEAAREYVEVLSRNPFVEEVYIKGSRSPLSKKTAREDSDWDIEVTTTTPNLKIVSPRTTGALHADLHIVDKPSVISIPIKEIL